MPKHKYVKSISFVLKRNVHLYGSIQFGYKKNSSICVLFDPGPLVQATSFSNGLIFFLN